MSENGEIYTTGKNFTLPPVVTGWTNSTSVLGDKTDDHDDSSLADDVSSVDIHHTDAATDNERLP